MQKPLEKTISTKEMRRLAQKGEAKFEYFARDPECMALVYGALYMINKRNGGHYNLISENFPPPNNTHY